MSLANRLRVISVVLLGGAAALAANLPWGHPGWFGLPILAIAVGVCETALINVTVARQRVTFSLTDGVVAAAFLLAPGLVVGCRRTRRACCRCCSSPASRR